MTPQGIKKIMLDEQEIAKKVKEMGAVIAGDYQGKRPLFISILKATLYFFADLTRTIDYPVDIDFMAIGVIPNTTSKTGVVRITKDLDTDITGRHVLMVEDIVNTGLTIGYLMQNLMSRKPESLKVCTLLDNPGPRLVHIPLAYCGFTVPDVPLAGYGMDRKDRYRNLPYIAELEG
jgi:hypoxanthine phosphoribosyltransferase